MTPKQTIHRGGKTKATKRSGLIDEPANSGEEYETSQTWEAKKLKLALSPTTFSRVDS
ncbi:hypothetical protein HAX54_024172, partial [Datura stramonium]|nr:hypothetical protein [Datura stramonium]